ncbi:S-adenosyl-L-methionine-dependent methyltransferase [Cinara cedri]|uniref:S-adenosyl-L-methionine-dependent methyltransferase n=1 Tax=Cinara cedri TaxID=506608 RepID=A0A5E4MV59_9HEMI|nr:S-adenosyl-L-methionine-dependent methyltransferase [Cinara cedri]
MGQFVSTSQLDSDNSNDELINSLIKNEYIHTIKVEKAFRSVDRGFYYNDEEKHHAYRDSAWQSEAMHLSAPCVYATVLECLELCSGHKFLNIGSGIGYFSTVAGFLLGRNGVNHGIEINKTLIDFAHEKAAEFKLNAAAIDYHDLCEPIFIQGNACELLPTGYYDRVYCGAAVPPEKSEFMKSLIKIGGILVMPLEGSLLKVTRKDEHLWNTVEVLGVTFTNLIVPERCSFKTVTFPPVEPLTLQELCRSNIRLFMRENLQNQTPELKMRTKCNLVINPDKRFGIDPFNQFVRIQYGGDPEETLHLQNIVNTITGLNDSSSDESSVIEEEEFMNDEDIIDSDNDEEENNMAEALSDESCKRKSSEAGCSNQHKTSTESENPKRMRMNSTTLSLPSTSSQTISDLWETISTDTTRSSVLNNDDNVSWISSIDSNEYEGFFGESPRNHYINGVYRSLFDNLDRSSNESEDNSEATSDLTKYSFISDYRFNELSKRLKETIYSLSIPTRLKLFLNYNRID